MRLQGDTGDDILIGGAGRDTYIFNRGDGRDTSDNTNILRFGAGISASDVTLENSLNVLRELFTGITLDANMRTPTMVDATSRDQFYTNLYDLKNTTNYQTLTGQVTIMPLAGLGGSDLRFLLTGMAFLVAVAITLNIFLKTKPRRCH